jgi:hypothetical protein
VRYRHQLVDVGFFLGHAEREITDIAIGIGIHVVRLDSVEPFLLAEGDPVGHDRLQCFVARRDRGRPVGHVDELLAWPSGHIAAQLGRVELTVVRTPVFSRAGVDVADRMSTHCMDGVHGRLDRAVSNRHSC